MASHVSIYNTPCAFERLTRFPNYYKTPFLSTGRDCNTVKANKTPFLSTGRDCNTVKAIAEKRDNLDHLHRARQFQPQQKKKTDQVSFPGTWGSFPSARTAQQMMETMDTLMEDPLAYSGNWTLLPQRVRDGYKQGRTPWAIKERENEYKIRFDMPGMTKNDVKVWIEAKNMLVIKAEKVPRKRKNQANGDGSPVEEDEWPNNSYGSYSGRIELPENIDFEKIQAEVRDGVLYLTIPKASATNKVIDINVQ